MTVANGWHPVSLSTALEAGTSAGATLFGEDIVVWRDNSGFAHVWEDRCPHRGMRLSFGFVRGDHIACLYHGWQYDTAGQCRYIPAHPDLSVPETIKAQVYGVREDGGMIWTQLASADDRSEPQGVTGGVPVRSVYVDRPAGALPAEIEATALAFYGPATTMQHEAPTCVAITGEDQTVRIGIQTVSETRSGLHLVLAAAPKIDGKDALRRAHAFALALRYRLENPPIHAVMPAAPAMAEVL